MPRRKPAASRPARPPRRRHGSVLPRCFRGCVGEPVAEPEPVVGVAQPQPDVGIAHPQPDVGVAQPQPNAIADLVSPHAVADPDSNPESQTDPYSERQAVTYAHPRSQPFAQSPGDTNTGSEGRADIAQRALPGAG